MLRNMNLELKHIAGYLPYRLKIKTNNQIRELVSGTELIDINNETTAVYNVISGKGHKPILRQMSDLTKEIEHNGEKFIPLDKLTNIVDLNTDVYELRFEYRLFVLYNKIDKYYTIQDNNFSFCEKLDEWHFDWKYDLIKKGLAIDINTLP